MKEAKLKVMIEKKEDNSALYIKVEDSGDYPDVIFVGDEVQLVLDQLNIPQFGGSRQDIFVFKGTYEECISKKREMLHKIEKALKNWTVEHYSFDGNSLYYG